MESPSLWVVLRGVVGFSLPIPLLYPSTQHSLVVALATASPHEKFFSTVSVVLLTCWGCVVLVRDFPSM
jgi:hypothetical protein